MSKKNSQKDWRSTKSFLQSIASGVFEATSRVNLKSPVKERRSKTSKCRRRLKGGVDGRGERLRSQLQSDGLISYFDTRKDSFAEGGGSPAIENHRLLLHSRGWRWGS